jgi:hypothetical protein
MILRLSNTSKEEFVLLIKVKLIYSLWEGKEEKQKVGREEEKGPLILKGFY